MLLYTGKMKYLVVSILFLAVLIGCESNDGKIPITTSSDEALHNFIKGRDLLENLRGQESLQYFDKAIEIDSNFAMAYFYNALSQPTINETFQQLDKALSLIDDISNGEKYIILGLQAQINNNQKKQEEVYIKLINEYPNDERSFWYYGNYFYVLQDYNKAIENYNKSIKINKKFAPAYNILGYSYRFLENYIKAEKVLKKYISLIPNDPNPYDSYGELLMKMGEYEASCDQYDKAIEQDSNFIASYIGISNNLNYTSQYEKARELLNNALKIARSDAERRQIYLSLAVSYADEGKFEEAIEQLNHQYNMAEQKNDAAIMANSLMNIANIYCEMNVYEKSRKLYRKAYDIIINSSLSDEIKHNASLTKLFIEALLHNVSNNKKSANEKARQYHKQAEEMKNVNIIRNSHELFGRIALENENYKEAIDELLQSNLQDPYNLYRLALSYNGIGNKEKAIEYLEKTVKFNALNNLNYAFCRTNAKKMLIDLR